MIVNVQFDLSDPMQRSNFERLVGWQAESRTTDAPAVFETKATSKPDLEFPPKKEIEGPSIQKIQTKFKECQDLDANAAKELMKGLLAHHGCKAVKDLSDAGRLALMADLDDFLRARGPQ